MLQIYFDVCTATKTQGIYGAKTNPFYTGGGHLPTSRLEKVSNFEIC